MLTHPLAVAQVVDFYLDDKYAKERAEIIKLVQKDDAASMDLIVGYVKEAQSACADCLLKFDTKPLYLIIRIESPGNIIIIDGIFVT